MHFITGLTLLASLVSASPFDIVKRDDVPLKAMLVKSTGNTLVKIQLSNKSRSPIKAFTTGSILGTAATEKVNVYSNGTRLPFDGVRLRIAPSSLMTEDAFQTIKPGQTIDIPFDIGTMHDLGEGGVYNLVVNSAISYAKSDSLNISGTIPINSNTLTLKDVDAKKAALTRMAFHQSVKRTLVNSDCQGSNNDMVNLSLRNCVRLARQAATGTSNSTRMSEYFKDASAIAKSNVTTVFNKVAVECQNRTLGYSQLYCGDVHKSCNPGVLAYTVPSANYMVYCPLYFTALPNITTVCHGQDQASTTIHEMTHLVQMKGTLDYGAYGYNSLKALTNGQNLNHADTYCLFANAVNIGTC